MVIVEARVSVLGKHRRKWAIALASILGSSRPVGNHPTTLKLFANLSMHDSKVCHFSIFQGEAATAQHNTKTSDVV